MSIINNMSLLLRIINFTDLYESMYQKLNISSFKNKFCDTQILILLLDRK